MVTAVLDGSDLGDDLPGLELPCVFFVPELLDEAGVHSVLLEEPMDQCRLDDELHGNLGLRPLMLHHVVDDCLEVNTVQLMPAPAFAFAKRDLVFEVKPAVLTFLVEAFPGIVAVTEGGHLKLLDHSSCHLLFIFSAPLLDFQDDGLANVNDLVSVREKLFLTESFVIQVPVTTLSIERFRIK